MSVQCSEKIGDQMSENPKQQPRKEEDGPPEPKVGGISGVKETMKERSELTEQHLPKDGNEPRESEIGTILGVGKTDDRRPDVPCKPPTRKSKLGKEPGAGEMPKVRRIRVQKSVLHNDDFTGKGDVAIEASETDVTGGLTVNDKSPRTPRHPAEDGSMVQEPEKDDASGTKNRRMKTIFLNHVLPVSFFLLFSIFVFRGLIGHGNVIAGADLVKPPELSRFFKFFYPMWSEYEGISVLPRLPQLIYYLPFFGIGALFNMNTKQVLLMVFIFNRTLAGVSMYYASRYLLKRSYKKINIKITVASFVAGFAYLANGYLTHHSTHPLIQASFAFAPLIILSLIVGLERKKLRYVVLAGFLWSMVSGDVHWIVFGAILLYAFIFYNFIATYVRSFHEGKLRALKTSFFEFFKNSAILGVSFFSFSAYWFIPGFLMGGSSRFAQYLEPESLVQWYNKATLLNIISRQDDSPKAYHVGEELLSSLGSHDVAIWIGVGIFLIGMLAIVLKPKNRYVIFFFIFAVITVFLTTCVNIAPRIGTWIILEAPFHGYYGWALRTPKISQLVSLSMGFLLAFTVMEMLRRIGNIPRIHLKRFKSGISVTVVLIIILSILLPNWSLTTGDLDGNLKSSVLPDEFSQVNAWLEEQEGDFKVLWIPKYRSRKVFWNEGPITKQDIAGHTSSVPTYVWDTAQKQPNTYGIYFLFSTITHSSPYSMLLGNSTSNLGEILSPLGIKFLIFHEDHAIDSGEDVLLENLRHQEDMELVEEFGFIYVFENKYMEDVTDARFFIPSKDLLVTGGLDALTTLSSIPSNDLTNNGVIFGNQRRYDIAELHDVTDDIVLTRSSGLEELIFTFVDEKYLVVPYYQNRHTRSTTTWNKYNWEITRPLISKKGRMKGWEWVYYEDLVITWPRKDTDISHGPIMEHYDFETDPGDFESRSANLTLSLSKTSKIGESSLKGNVMKGDASMAESATTARLELDNNEGDHQLMMYLRGKDVNDMQVLMNYFDSDKKSIGAEVLGKEGGTFKYKKIERNITIPNDAKYYSLQIKTFRNPDAFSSWWIDDVRIYRSDPDNDYNVMDMEFDLDSTGEYELFVRSFKGQVGGSIAISLDGEIIKNVNTIHFSNSFYWEMIDSITINKGKHTLSMKSRDGFNAVNLFAVVPKEKMDEYRGQAEGLLNGGGLIYALEAESNLIFEGARISDAYGGAASSGEVLEVGDGSDGRLYMEVIEPGNYSMYMKLLPGMGSDRYSVQIGDESYEFDYIGASNITRDISTISYSKDNILDLSFENGWSSTAEAPNGWFPPRSKYIFNVTNYTDYILNLSFEEGWDPDLEVPYDWYPPHSNYSASLDRLVKTEGIYSLRLTTNSTESKTWSNMDSIDRSVEPGGNYSVKIDMKFENSNGTKVKIRGLNTSNGKWEDVVKMMGRLTGTGTKDWKEYAASFNVSEYISKVKVTLDVGNVLNSTQGNVTVWFDDFQLFRDKEEMKDESIVFSAALDTTERTDGDYSLKLTTNNNSPKTWSWMNSKEFQVESGRTYEVRMDVRLENSNGSHMLVRGYNETTNKWQDLVRILGKIDSASIMGWTGYAKSFYVPVEMSRIKFTINAGSVLEEFLGNATTWIDDIRLSLDEEEGKYEIVVSGNYSNIPEFREERDFSWINITDIYLDKGMNEMKFSTSSPEMKLLKMSFEEGWNEYMGAPNLWYPPKSEYSTSLDDVHRTDGSKSLKLTTNITEITDSTGMEGSEIVLETNRSYRARMDVKLENIKASSVGILGYNEAVEKWQNIAYLMTDKEGTGSQGWETYETTFFMSKDISIIKVVLNGGSVLDVADGNGTVWFDDLEVTLDTGDFDTKIDLILLCSNGNYRSLEDIFNQEPDAVIRDYRRIDATRYEVDITSNGPFMLAFGETFDDYWIARIPGSGNIKSIPLYGVINGYYINRTGNFTVIIEFKPQDWFEIGLGITTLSITVSLVFLICADRKLWGKRFISLAEKMSRLKRRTKGH